MIRFLIEYALPVEENIWPIAGFTTADDLQIISYEAQKFTNQGSQAFLHWSESTTSDV